MIYSQRNMNFIRVVSTTLALTWAAGIPAAPGDLPSPDAMALGGRVVPRALLAGFRRGMEEEQLERIAATRPALTEPERQRALAAMSPLLDEAFPPELLAGIGAQFLSSHYDAAELRELRRI